MPTPRRLPLFAGLAALTLVVACTTDPYTGERQASRTAIGAGVGAGVGAAAGAIFGGGKGAAWGAGAGLLAGAGVGAYMDSQEAKLRRELQGTGVSVTRQGDNIILNMPGNITFPTNSSQLQPQFLPTLDSVTKVVQEFDQTMIDVVGHTDSTGAADYNLRLSNERALSVGTYLQAKGVDGRRIVSRGVGMNLPIASNETVQGRALNRRVEIALVPIVK